MKKSNILNKLLIINISAFILCGFVFSKTFAWDDCQQSDDTLIFDHCGVAIYDFATEYDIPEGYIYEILSGEGDIDANTGIWTYVPGGYDLCIYLGLVVQACDEEIPPNCVTCRLCIYADNQRPLFINKYDTVDAYWNNIINYHANFDGDVCDVHQYTMLDDGGSAGTLILDQWSGVITFTPDTADSFITTVISVEDQIGYADTCEVSFNCSEYPYDTLFILDTTFMTTPEPLFVRSGYLNNDNYNDLIISNPDSSSIGILINLGNGSFTNDSTVTIGGLPFSSEICDLDQDNDNDIIISNLEQIAVLYNEGGIFQSPVYYDAGSTPYYIKATNLNNDNYLDLAVLNGNFGSDSISILLNNEYGILSYDSSYFLNWNAPLGITAADLNSDDNNDLAISGYESDSIAIMINNGDGTFANPQNTYSGGSSASIFAADYNLDSLIDLVVSMVDYDSIGILYGLGDGSFAAPVFIPIGGKADQVTNLFSEDFDNDGDLDIAVGGFLVDRITILINDGDGTFTKTFNHQVEQNLNAIHGADFDGNNSCDIVLVHTDSVSVLLNRLDFSNCMLQYYEFEHCSLGEYSFYFSGSDEFWILEGPGTINNSGAWYYEPSTMVGEDTVVVQGCDYDQQPTYYQTCSLIVDWTNEFPQFSIEWDTANVYWGQTIEHYMEFADCDSVILYLIDNGGAMGEMALMIVDVNMGVITYTPDFFDQDINAVVEISDGSYSDTCNIFFHMTEYPEDTIFTFGQYLSMGDNHPMSICAGDLDNDGDNDLATHNIWTDGSVSVILNDGNAVFQPAVTYEGGNITPYILSADMDNDNDSDLVIPIVSISDEKFGVGVFFNNGDGTFQTMQQNLINEELMDPSGNMAAEDFDNDDDNDIALVTDFGVLIMDNSGDGTLTPVYPLLTGGGCLAAADFNQDEYIDLACASYSTNSIIIYLNAGDGSFQGPTYYTVDSCPISISCEDFNSDSSVDIAIVNSETESVAFLFNTGIGTFSDPEYYYIHPIYNYSGFGVLNQILYSDDFDCDNDNDIAVICYESKELAILLNDGNGIFDIKYNPYNPYFEFQPFARAITGEDFNGDNTCDIALILMSDSALYDIQIMNNQSVCDTASEPILNFVGISGYENDAVDPDTGISNQDYVFRLKYSDPNGDPPMSGYPKLLLDLNGDADSVGSGLHETEYTMQIEEPGNFHDGVIYSCIVPVLPIGNSIQYAFEAYDTTGERAIASEQLVKWFTSGPVIINDNIDLYIYASMIEFSENNPGIDEAFQSYVQIYNNSDITLSDVLIHYHVQIDFQDTLVDSIMIDFLPPGYYNLPNRDWQFENIGFYPITVIIDPHNSIEEWNEDNNSAVRPIQVGEYTVPGSMALNISGPSSLCQSVYSSLNGNGYYYLPPSDYLGPVIGGQVTITILETEQSWIGHTGQNGNFQVGFLAPEEPGDYHLEIELTDFTLTNIDTLVFSVYDCYEPEPVCPNLTTSLSLSNLPLTVDYNPTTTYNASVYNNGNDTAFSFSFSIKAGTELITSVLIDTLLPGDSYNLPTGQITYNQTGTYCVYAIADESNQVIECNENDNHISRCHTVWPNCPDLVAEALWLSDNSPVQGQPISISARISNYGGRIAENINVLFYDSGIVFDSITITSLAAFGEKTTKSVNYVFSSAELHDLRVIVDPYDVIDECNEYNNSKEKAVNVIGLQPDLYTNNRRLKAMNHSQPHFPIQADDTTRFSIEISNLGTETADTVTLHYYVDEELFSVDTIFNLMPDSTVIDTSASLWSLDFDICSVSVYVDMNNIIDEYNENNNYAVQNVIFELTPYYTHKCGYPASSSCFVDSCQSDMPGVYLGNPISITGSAMNYGLFQLYDTVSIEISDNIEGILGYVTIDSLLEKALNFRSGAIVHTFTTPGWHIITIHVDNEDEYVECNNSNNSYVDSIYVYTYKPDIFLYSEHIDPSNINPEVDEEVSIDATLWNIGEVTAESVSVVFEIDDIILGDTVWIDSIPIEPDNNYRTIGATETWTATNLPQNQHVIKVTGDAAARLDELDEANNIATREIVVGTVANLSVTENSILFSEEFAKPGTEILVSVWVKNTGGLDASGTVELYYITQSMNTIPIGSEIASVLGYGDSSKVDFAWILPSESSVYVRIELIDIFPDDFNPADNIAVVDYNISPLTFCDYFEGLFCDDFDDQTITEWQVLTGSIDDWIEEDGVLKASSNIPEYRSIIYAGDAGWTDYILEAKIMGNNGVDKTLAFRIQDENNYYTIDIRSDYPSPGIDEIAFGKMENGVYYADKAVCDYNSENGEWYQLRIDCLDNRFIAYVNDAPILTYIDNDNYFMDGRIGLVCWTGYAGNCSIQFDNVTVSEFSILEGHVNTAQIEPIIIENALLEFYQDGFLINCTNSGLNGEYSVKMAEGIYDAIISKTGFEILEVENIHIPKGGTVQNFEMMDDFYANLDLHISFPDNLADYQEFDEDMATEKFIIRALVHNNEDRDLQDVHLEILVEDEIQPIDLGPFDTDPPDGLIDDLLHGDLPSHWNCEVEVPAIWKEKTIEARIVSVEGWKIPECQVEKQISILYLQQGGPYQMDIDAYNFDNPTSNLIFDWIRSHDGSILKYFFPIVLNSARGNCYGMAASSNWYFLNPGDIPAPTTTYGLELDMPGVANEIVEFHLSQIFGPAWIFGLLGGQPPNEAALQISSDIEAQKTVALMLKDSERWLGIIPYRHAISAYKSIYDHSEEKQYVYVYENNDPYPFSIYDNNIITFDLEEGSFEYRTYIEMRVFENLVKLSVEEIIDGLWEFIKDSPLNFWQMGKRLLHIGCPVQPLIMDNFGNRLGFIDDTTWVNEIDSANFAFIYVDSADSSFYFELPLELDYDISILGITTGSMDIFSFTSLSDSSGRFSMFDSISISSESAVDFQLNSASNVIDSIIIDFNGDEIPDSIIYPNINTPPGSFMLVNPDNGQNVHDTISFCWNSATNLDWGDELEYNIVLSNDSLFTDSLMFSSGLDTTLIIADPGVGSTIYWKVYATDLQSESTRSRQIFYFRYNEFICGDANSDETVNIFDITYVISYLYLSGPPPNPTESADVNNDGTVNIFDITYLISYLYLEGPEPTCP